MANEIAVWVRFHEFWMAVAQHIPVLPLRYEDLILNKQVRLGRGRCLCKAGIDVSMRQEEEAD